MRLQDNFWENFGSLSEQEADSLIKPFSEKEIKEALNDMKTNSAPGLDGLPAEFYKCF
jgi:Mg/Co/Ni transporter MgtE